MQLELNDKVRIFKVRGGITIKDFGKIFLEANEMISFKTETGKEYDFTAKEWGFYATPSINGRLKKEGFRTALVVNEDNKIFIMVVEIEKIPLFKKYLKKNQDNKMICWLDEWFEDKK